MGNIQDMESYRRPGPPGRDPSPPVLDMTADGQFRDAPPLARSWLDRALGKLGGTFATAGKLEQTFDLPVIGTISHMLTEAARTLRKRKMKQFAAASGGLGALFLVLLAVEFVQRGMVA